MLINQHHNMKKTILICTAMVALAAMTLSCTKIRTKIADWLSEGVKEDFHIGSLYPELDDSPCCGIRKEGIFYEYWFRYKATPSKVESALFAKPCEYTEIVPDTALVPCSRDYAIDNFKFGSEEYFCVFVEWKTAPETNLLYYRCTRTPLEHLMIFDTISGEAYHYISEFRE